MELKRRLEISSKKTFLISIIALLISLSTFSIIFHYAGVGIVEGYSTLFGKAFLGDGLLRTIRRFIFLFLLALAFIVPAKAGLWNVGAQGQFYLGAIVATGVSYTLTDAPAALIIPIMAIAGMAGGAAWAFIPAYLKGKWSVNEIVSTIMLNYVAVQIAAYLVVRGPWAVGGGRPWSVPIPDQAWIPTIGSTAVSWAIIVPIIAAVGLIYIFKRTTFGYEINVFGTSREPAKYSGMDSRKLTLLTFIIGGALAGFAGYSYLASVLGQFTTGGYFVPPWGFYAIAFGLFVGLDIVSAALYSFVVTSILVGGEGLTVALDISTGVTLTFIGILFIINIALQVFRIYEFDIDFPWSRGE